jgi:hypothetical protein
MLEASVGCGGDRPMTLIAALDAPAEYRDIRSNATLWRGQ